MSKTTKEEKVELVVKVKGSKNEKVKVLSKVVYSELQESGGFKASVIEKGLKAMYSGKEGFNKDYPLEGLRVDMEVLVDLEGEDTLKVVLPKEKLYYGDKGVYVLNRVVKFMGKVMPMVEVQVRDSKVEDIEKDKMIERIKTRLVLGLNTLSYCDIEGSTNRLLTEGDVEEVIKVLDGYKFNEEEYKGLEIAIVSNYCETCKGYDEENPYHLMITSVNKDEKENILKDLNTNKISLYLYDTK